MSKLLSSLTKRLSFLSSKQFIGEDLQGNKYFEILQEGKKNKRIVETVDSDPMNYSGDQLPAEWRSWLTYRRIAPPTKEELIHFEQHRKLVKQKAAELEKSFQIEDQQHLTEIEKPQGSGESFVPGAWVPKNNK